MSQITYFDDTNRLQLHPSLTWSDAFKILADYEKEQPEDKRLLVQQQGKWQKKESVSSQMILQALHDYEGE